MVLWDFRAHSMRVLLFALILAVAFTAAAPFGSAQESGAHHKAAGPHAARRGKNTAKPHGQRRAPSHVRPSTRHSIHPVPAPYAVRHRSPRHGAHMVRARMGIRHYGWMDSSAATHRPHVVDAPSDEVADARTAEAVGPEDSAEPDTPANLASANDHASSASAPPLAPETAVAEAASGSSRTVAATTSSSAPHAEVEAAAPHSGALPAELRSRSIIAMAPLRGSLESLMRQNDKTNADNLERIEDDSDLHQRIASGMLVPVPASDALTVNADLPQDRRYCRPWTATFLKDFAHAHMTQFHRPFEVSSAVRTVQYQKHLMLINGNAAPAEGDVASPHLTGATIDIAKHGMTRSELYWMRNRLSALQDAGKIDVEEEFHQACFHITVYKSYIGAGPLHKRRQAVPAPPAEGAGDSSVPAGDPSTGL